MNDASAIPATETAFSDAEAVARYADKPRRLVPGWADLHRMTALLLAERVPADGRVLVLGAGGGLELKALAQAQSGWTFDGVDPSVEMLKLARQTLGEFNARVQLHEGYIEAAPEVLFDGATCLLTMHFIPREERRRTLAEMRRRLKPGAPLIVAHMSIPQGEVRSQWFSRYAAFAVSSGIDMDLAQAGRLAVESRLQILAPEEEEEILREAGFGNVGLFYAGFTFRGWVAYAE